MDIVTHLTILFDHYEGLLNEKQKLYFIDYYFNNLSLSEMSENFNVSRNAIHKQLKAIEKKLYAYESKLKLFEKSQKLESFINDIKDKDIKAKLIKLDLL